MRLTSPLTVMRTGACLRTDTHPDLTQVPELPEFASRTAKALDGIKAAESILKSRA